MYTKRLYVLNILKNEQMLELPASSKLIQRHNFY